MHTPECSEPTAVGVHPSSLKSAKLPKVKLHLYAPGHRDGHIGQIRPGVPAIVTGRIADRKLLKCGAAEQPLVKQIHESFPLPRHDKLGVIRAFVCLHRIVSHLVQNLSQLGRSAVSDISNRYNISPEAVEHMLISVNNGGGQMAQFNCPELGGSGQWMRGGMTMVGDMFNHGLKSTVDNLCTELSNLLASTQVFPEVPAGTPGSLQWWPTALGSPISSGSQNNTRYALFEKRLAVEVNGKVTVYDTLEHQIGGVSQQQGGDSSLTFSSQLGTIPVSSLPVVNEAGSSPIASTNFASEEVHSSGNHSTPPHVDNSDDNLRDSSTSAVSSISASSTDSGNDIIALIEKLAQLHVAGMLTDEEFSAKKQELLLRL